MKTQKWIALFLLQACMAFGQQDTCIDFENFTAGTGFSSGQSFAEDGVLMTIRSYVNANDEIVFGTSSISSTSPHVGQSLSLANATVEFDFGCATDVTLVYGNQGGNINISINGDLRVIKTVGPSYTIGGVDVSINAGPSGGTMTFNQSGAPVNSLSVGGQEFRVDHICFLPCDNPDCLDFEGVGENKRFVGDSFMEDGITVAVGPFNESEDGSVVGSGNNNAGGLGSELSILKASIQLNVECSGGVGFLYHQSANGILLTINGQTVQADTFSALNGQTVDGVTISVSGGMVMLTGVIETLGIGGNALAIDHLCVMDCPMNCIDFEGETVGTKYFKGESLAEDGVTMTLNNFQGAEGQATIEDRQRAGHSGNDIALDDAVLQIGIPCAKEIVLHFGQYQAGVYLAHKEGEWTEASMLDFDGQTLAGMAVEVDAVLINGNLIGTLTLTGMIENFAIGGIELVIDHVCHEACPNPDCVEFELFPLGKTYALYDTLQEELTVMLITEFTPTSGSKAWIGSENFAGETGNELQLTNAQVTVEFLGASRVEISYGTPGIGGVRLGVNGSTLLVGSFTQLDSQFLGGGAIQVTGDSNQGKIVIRGGDITSITIGGNQVSIDRICHTDRTLGENCVDFEAAPPLTIYSYDNFAFFEEDDLIFYPIPFDLSSSEDISGGITQITTNQMAGHLGKELWLSNATMQIFGPACMEDLAFRFGEYGGIVNLRINDQQVIIDDMIALNGVTLGGVSITVSTIPVAGGVVGLVQLDGLVFSLEIGGQDLYIDHLCYDECPPISVGDIVFFSAEPLNATDRKIVIDVDQVMGPAVLRIHRRAALIGGNWSSISTTTTTAPGGDASVKRNEAVVPLNEDTGFFRVRAYYR